MATTGTTTTTINTYTLYDEDGNWIGDYDSTGASKQQAVWFGSAPVGLVVGSGGTQKLHYVQPDHLGTPRAVIDPIRNVAVWTWDAKSEAFGDSPPNQDPDLDGTAFVFNMRFPGQRYDAGSGLIYNYFRDYDPATGRYIQSDPIGLGGGINTYAYAGSFPIQAIDPHGLEVESYDGAEVPLPFWLERRLVGEAAHQAFTRYTRRLNNFGANDSYEGTFNGLKPDAYNRYFKQIFELKPLTNRDQEHLYKEVATRQMRGYVRAANRNNDNHCGGWVPGNSALLKFTDGQNIGPVTVAGNMYDIKPYHDTHPGNTGLVFYRADMIKEGRMEYVEAVLKGLAS